MARLIEPDLDFKRAILGRLDGHDLTACYQCGTCSTVCPLSTAGDPFPRTEMVWVQWGLRDRVLGSASIWTCHQCGACNSYCPRDAKPAHVMAALRDYSIGHHAVPAFMGRALGEPRALPLLLGLPVAVLGAVLAWLGHLRALPEGRIVFSKLVPIAAIEVVFTLAVALSALAGLAGLVVTTASVGVGIYAFGYLTPWPLWHPVKILGNVSGAAVIVALCVFFWRRIADGARAGKNTYSDWLFLAILLLTTLTGFLAQWLRLADLPRLAYPAYFVHLVLVFFLLVYLPYSKLAHLVYRTTAMLWTARAR